MWRRVASQSPTTAQESKDASSYLNAWDALGKMLALGKSLSGGERNCCFLNLDSRSFANVSAAAGFDLPADGRGLAVTDWNDDGKLDVWLTNRTAPRVQLLKNNYPDSSHSVTLRLRGKTCNRDAIGARVVVVDAEDRSKRSFKSLRAGEGYLSQSSKSLHFGLGPKTSRVHMKVNWPDGSSDVFRDMAVDCNYLIEQGGSMKKQARRAAVLDSSDDASRPIASTPNKRIVLPARVPMPTVEYQQFDGTMATLSLADESPSNKPKLLNVWATWCEPCVTELTEWTNHASELNRLADVVLLSADLVTGNGADQSKIQATLSKVGATFKSGLANQETMELLDIVQQHLSKRIRPLTAPTTFLIDSNGDLAVVYKGGVPWTNLKRDLHAVERNIEHRDLAVPFAGSWYTNPFPPDLLALANAYRERGKYDSSLDYLLLCLPKIRSDKRIQPVAGQVSQFLIDLGLDFQKSNKPARVVESLEAATQLTPNDFKSQMALNMLYQQAKRYDKVVTQHRKLLKIKPGDIVLTNNLAWILATCPDEQVRSPQEAVSLAMTVCERTQRKVPSALDTLAAALAGDGQFDQAIQVAREAIKLFEAANDSAGAERLQKRLAHYERGEAFVDQ